MLRYNEKNSSRRSSSSKQVNITFPKYMLRLFSVGFIFLLLAGKNKTVNSGVQVTNETVMIPVIEDTFISSSHPYVNFGLGESLRIGDYSGAQFRTLLKFDVQSYIPSGATIQSADLRLHPLGTSPVVQFRTYQLSRSWSENNVTFTNDPYLSTDPSLPFTLTSFSGTQNFNITSFVQDWVDGTKDNHGLELIPRYTYSNFRELRAKEWPYGLRSEIYVTYTPPPKEWTLMYFLAEDNNLSDEGHGIFQFEQLRNGAVNNNINITAFYDGRGTQASYLGLASDENNEVIQYIGEVSTGDPTVLTDFIQWSQAMYPAGNYALILYDHSSGVSGFGTDEHPENDGTDCIKEGDACLTPNEMQQALVTIPKLEVIYLEGCSSATIELAFELRAQADYFVASQQTAWGPASHVNVLQNIDATTSAEDLAVSMAQNYYHIFKEIYTDQNVEDKPGTVSVVDLTKIDTVISDIDNLARLLEENIVTNFLTLASIVLDVQHLDSDGDFDIDLEDEFIDLYHFAYLVNADFDDPAIQNNAQALLSSLDEYIVWNRTWSGSFSIPRDPCVLPRKCVWDLDNSYGVSIFFTEYSRSFYEDGWLEFTAGTFWDIFTTESETTHSLTNTIGWGPMLVEYVREANHNQPDNPYAPDLQPPLNSLSYSYLPMIEK